MGKYLFALATIVACLNAHADRKIYSCKDANGTAVFSSQPCGQDAKEMNVDAGQSSAPLPPGTIPPQRPTPQTNDAIRDISDSVADNDCRRNAKSAAIYPTEENLRQLEAKRRSIEKDEQYANNNLAGAVYDNGIRKQLGDIDVAIATERTRITQESGRVDKAYRDATAGCDQAKAQREQARAAH